MKLMYAAIPETFVVLFMCTSYKCVFSSVFYHLVHFFFHYYLIGRNCCFWALCVCLYNGYCDFGRWSLFVL